MRRRESAAFVFLTAGAFASQEVREGAFDASSLYRFVNVEGDMILRGELKRALIMADAKLRVMVFALTLNRHH